MSDAYYFTDKDNGNDGDAGTDMDNAWLTAEKAFENAFAPASTDRYEIFIRRTLNEAQDDDIVFAGEGNANEPLVFMGWPRNLKTGTADFTNGESVVTDFSIATSRSLYCGRRIRSDVDEKWYLTTAVCMKIIYDNQQGGESFSKGDTVVSDNGDPGEGKIQMVIDNDPVGIIWIVVRAGTFADDDELAVGATHIADIDGVPDADDGLCIDREYEGDTEDDGNFTIQEDEDYHRITTSLGFSGATNDTVTTASNHPWDTGELLFVNSDDTLPAGLSADTQYFCIKTGADTMELALSRADAFAGTAVDITDTGTGTHTIQHINDFDWTIQMSDWNGDAETLPILDFDGGAQQFFSNNKDYWSLKYFELRDSSDTSGILNVKSGYGAFVLGVHLMGVQNTEVLWVVNTRCKIRRILVIGNSIGNSQVGIISSAGALTDVEDAAIYNMGDQGIFANAGTFKLTNVNIGIELNNGDEDISMTTTLPIEAKDLSVGGSNGDFLFQGRQPLNVIRIGNYQKAFGEHRQILPNGAYITKNDGSGADVNLRAGGAAFVIEYSSPSAAEYATWEEWAYEMFCADFFQEASTTKNYKFYVQCDAAINMSDAYGASNLWLEAIALDTYEDISKYTYQKDANGYYSPRSVSSSNPIPAKADNDDYTGYLSISVTTPAVSSIVRIRGKVNYYHATAKIFVDPQPDIS